MTEKYFFGEHFQGFGNKWDALFENFEKFFCEKFSHVIQNGKIYFEHIKNNKKYWALTNDKKAPITITTLIKQNKKTNDVISFFPMMKGIKNEVVLKNKYDWKSKIEGEFACILNNDNEIILNFFDGNYCLDVEKFQINKKINVSISAIAFLLDKFEEKEIEIEQGAFYESRLKEFLENNTNKTKEDFETPKIALTSDRFRMLVPTEYTCEYEGVGQIEDINSVDFFHEKITILKVNFGHKNDNDTFYCNLYVSEKVLKGYKPKINDAISSLFWLSGQFEE